MSFSFAISPLLMPLAATENVVDLFSATTDIDTMLRFEIALAEAQEKANQLPKGASRQIQLAATKIDKDPSTFAQAMARDGVIVPELVARLKAALPKAYQAYVHQNITSQDVIDTSLMLRAKDAVSIISRDLQRSSKCLSVLHKKFGAKPLMARTRMQRALPISVADRLSIWQANLSAAEAALAMLNFPLQLSGPIGTFSPPYKKALAKALRLSCLDYSWQAERSPILAIGNACAGVCVALGKIGMDVALMAQNEIAEIKLGGGGMSSAMQHKQNPVKAEVLVSLARFSATQVSALHNAAVHEQERSGAAWTLEWLALPQLICASSGSAHLCSELLQSVESLGS